jgi:hypothetical protein
MIEAVARAQQRFEHESIALPKCAKPSKHSLFQQPASVDHMSFVEAERIEV